MPGIPISIEERRGNRQDRIPSVRHFRVSTPAENPLIMGGAAVLVAAVGAQYILKLYGSYEHNKGGGKDAPSEASSEGGEGEENTVKSEAMRSAEGNSVGNETQAGGVGHRESVEGEAQADAPRPKTRRQREKEREQERAKAREERAKAREKEREQAKKVPGGGGFFNDFMTDFMHQMGGSKTAWADTKAGWFAKNFYDGGFEDKMTKREAALILGVRESTSAHRIKEQHRKILLINHPDRGGSPYISAKINEAKDLLIKGKGK